MDLPNLDGRGYARFLAAGSHYLKKYRSVLNDLNVYPVPDGDTGTNMYLTARSAARAAYASGNGPVSQVASRAADGALVGARGNSGVILAQMLRGFAHHVRHRDSLDTFSVATGVREAAAAARQALQNPTEGTIVSVADAAADAAYRLALHEPDLVRFLSGVLRFANDAVDRTPEQLPALRDAGVVDAGGAGFTYFLEGALALLPEGRVRSTAFPRRPVRAEVFSPKQSVGVMHYCTELVLEDATCSIAELRRALEPRSESLLVVGAPPTIKVHVHTDDPDRVKSVATRHGTITRVKVDDMAQQHAMLLIDGPRVERSIVAVVPGPGFETIVKELGAEVALVTSGSPSVGELVLALNNTVGDETLLFPNDANVVAAAREAVALCAKNARVIPTENVVEGVNALIALRGEGPRPIEEMDRAIARTRSARIFIASKTAVAGGVSVARGKAAAVYGDRWFAGETVSDVALDLVAAMRGATGGLVTLYYGGAQREKDAQRLSEELRSMNADTDAEYYYGGMKNAEYWVTFDE